MTSRPQSEGRLHRWRDESRTILQVTRDLVSATGRNDLLTYASAMCYQVIFALPAVLLAGLAILGFLDLQEAWSQELAPRIQQATSEQVFRFLDDSARGVLDSRNGFWLTLGSVLALWYISGATRALMGVMDRIYGAEDERSFWGRMGVSLLLSLAVAAGMVVTAAAISFGPELVAGLDVGMGLGLLAAALPWLLAVALLHLLMLLFVRYGPSHDGIRWGSLSAALIVIVWLGATVVFRWYVTSVANYASLFGNLASMIIFMVYLYLSSIVLIYGLQIDAMVRERLGDDSS